jgi:hypothetical protein
MLVEQSSVWREAGMREVGGKSTIAIAALFGALASCSSSARPGGQSAGHGAQQRGGNGATAAGAGAESVGGTSRAKDAGRAPAATPSDAGRASDGGAPADAAAQRDAASPPEIGASGALPSGDQGIAARHPHDDGIGSDPSVIFADDFESYHDAAGLEARWNAGVFGNRRIATAPELVYAGAQSLEFTSPMQSAELSNGVARTVAPELDLLFLRYYSRYDPSFDVVGSSHNGGGISAHYFNNGMATPGVPANGTNKYLIEYECWRGESAEPNPGSLNVYIYHPEQRSMWGDHFFPDGKVLPNTSIADDFGSEFVARPTVVPELGRWYSFEVMLKANHAGQRDGRIALWLDGALIADFQNLRLRDVDTLRIDRFGLSLHIGSNTVRETHKQYDNVVAATSYIGPLATH